MSTNDKFVDQITAIMRDADQKFEDIAADIFRLETNEGSTRHYVRDLLIPMMEEQGLVIVDKSNNLSSTLSIIEWIDINDRLPEKDVLVLICECSSGEHILMAVSYWDGTYSKYGEKLPQFPDFQDEQPGFYYPSYWMPLPQPPKTL